MENQQQNPASNAPTTSRAMNLLKRVQGSKEIVPIPAPAPAEPTHPKPVVESAPPQETKPETESEYDFNPPNPEEPKVEPAKAETPQDFVPEDPADEIDSLINPKDPAGVNFKKLRTKLKSLNGDHKKAIGELETLRKKVSDYETGIAVSDVTQAQLARINQLEQYEHLYNFKGSPVYQEKFAIPVKEEAGKAALLAKESGVDESIVDKVLEAGSSVEENRLISQNFKDELTALEFKSHIKEIKKIKAQAAEAEKEPAKSLARMQQENDAILADKRAKANEGIVYSSKSAWSESLVELRKDPRFPEITFREGDSEHNEKFVRPILNKAAQEYGRIVRTLAQHGMTELPKDLAMALARMTQLAHQSAAIGYHRDELFNRVHELETLMRSKGMLHRPGVNTGNGSNGAPKASPSTPVGAANAGAKVLSRVQAK